MPLSRPALRDEVPIRSRLRSLVLAFAAVTTLLVGGLWPVMALIDRRDALAAGERLAADGAALLEEKVRSTVDAANLILLHVTGQIEERGFAPFVASHRVWADLRTMADQLPEVGSIVVADRDGTVVLSSLSSPPPVATIADRAFFGTHRDGAATLVVGPAITGRITGHSVFTLSRRITAEDGTFGGVAVVAIGTDQFRTLHQTLSLGGRGGLGAIAIRRTDGTPLVRYPEGSDAALAAGGSIVMEQPVAGTPLVVSVAVERAAVLAGWRRRSLWAALLFGGGIVCVVGLSGLTLASVRRETTAMAAVADANEGLERRVEERTAALRAAMEEAERQSRAKSHFLANVSHELRTPLNAIIGFSELMGGGFAGPLTDKQRQYLDTIQQSGTHLLHIINDILDLSKISAEKLAITDQEVCIDTLVAACIELSRGRALGRPLTLVAEVEPGLPSLRGDELRLKQILINLLSNAIKFTPDFGTVTVRAALDADGGIVLAVADTGIGMSAEEIPRALALFGQLDNDLTRTHEGTGIGLPIARGLTELHGGRLAIASAPGQGTTVTLHFPAERTMAAGQPVG